jgi:hypothetical protein
MISERRLMPRREQFVVPSALRGTDYERALTRDLERNAR